MAYIYNFAKFTTWPQNTDKPNQLFIICVLNDELLFRKLQKLKSKKIHTKPIISRTLSTKEENIEQCHTLFIGNVSQSTLNDTIEYISHLPILTISDNKSFVNKGCVEFVPQEKSIQFSVNQTSLKRAHLEINARLLRLAKSIVD